MASQGSGSGLAAGSSVTLMGGNQSEHRRMFGLLAADKTGVAQILISHDAGTTWTIAKVIASTAPANADATYVNVIEIDSRLPFFWRLDLKNTGASAMAYRYDIDTYYDLQAAT